MEVQVISNKELHINEEIKDKEIRVIGADGDQLGIMTPRAALMLAMEKSLDLVMIAPQAIPPVCRIMDYGKFRFEQAKKDKEAKKNQRVVDIKEIRMFMKIDVNDFNTKVNHAIKFLQEGDKVKVTVRFRGREMAHTELGTVLLDRFAGACLGISAVEKPPKLEGRSMSLFLTAKLTK
jgi:translation initiation factor IF-3